jgi:hypothetical protein
MKEHLADLNNSYYLRENTNETSERMATYPDTNRATQDLKQLLHDHRNAGIQKFLHGLKPTASTDYSLWKTTKKLKPVTRHSTPIRTSQGTWARSNAEEAQAFDHHLASVFQPHPSDPNSTSEATLTPLL